MFRFEYMTLTQIGKIFGVSSQQVGKWLVQIDLRTPRTGQAVRRSLAVTWNSGRPAIKATSGAGTRRRRSRPWKKPGILGYRTRRRNLSIRRS